MLKKLMDAEIPMKMRGHKQVKLSNYAINLSCERQEKTTRFECNKLAFASAMIYGIIICTWTSSKRHKFGGNKFRQITFQLLWV